MTTWASSNRVRKEYLGQSIKATYSISVVSGDTGGTLTCGGFKTIDNASVFGWRVTGPTGLAITYYISGKTVVVAHNNPGENATIKATVWGRQG